MPIVVDEVVISVEVGASPGPTAGAQASSGSATTGEASGGDKPDTVALCVERVLQVLAEREER
jgi:hypothetical protein